MQVHVILLSALLPILFIIPLIPCLQCLVVGTFLMKKKEQNRENIFSFKLLMKRCSIMLDFKVGVLLTLHICKHLWKMYNDWIHWSKGKICINNENHSPSFHFRGKTRFKDFNNTGVIKKILINIRKLQKHDGSWQFLAFISLFLEEESTSSVPNVVSRSLPMWWKKKTIDFV